MAILRSLGSKSVAPAYCETVETPSATGVALVSLDRALTKLSAYLDLLTARDESSAPLDVHSIGATAEAITKVAQALSYIRSV
jgi:hypothetical protein